MPPIALVSALAWTLAPLALALALALAQEQEQEQEHAQTRA